MKSEMIMPLILPMPSIDKAIFASLTEGRQKILISLLKKGEQTFTSLLETSHLQPSSLSEALKSMEENGLVCKNEGKGYGLSKNGKLLGLMLMKPNGVKIEEIRATLNKLLETDYGINNPSEREELVENLKEFGDHIGLEEKKNA